MFVRVAVGGTAVAVQVAVGTAVLVEVAVGVNVAGGAFRIGTASMAKAFVVDVTDHAIVTVPETPALLLPAPVRLLLAVFTCTFQRLV